MFRTAIMVMKMGNAVHTVPLASDSHHTGAGSSSRRPTGRSSGYWARHRNVETHRASDTRRTAPRRRIRPSLSNRYTAYMTALTPISVAPQTMFG